MNEDPRVLQYWTGTPGVNLTDAGAPTPVDLGTQAFGAPPPAAAATPAPIGPPAPPPEVPDPFRAKLDAAFGPPKGPAQPVDPVTRAPVWDPEANPLKAGDIAFAPPGKPASAAAPINIPPEQLAKDNAAFESAQARSAPTQAARPAGPSAPANPDPYGIKEHQAGAMHAYDEMSEAQGLRGNAMREAGMLAAQQSAELRRRQDEDIQIARGEMETADKEFQSQFQALRSQLDGVREKKIDPTRATKDLGFMAVLGGLFGGIYQGIIKSDVNPFIRDLDRMIDRDIAIQERELDRDSQHFGEKLNLLGQQRALFKDKQSSDLALRAAYYESAEKQIESARAANLALADQAHLDEMAAATKLKKEETLLAWSERARANAAAAANQQYARSKEVQAMYRDVYDKVLQATGSAAQAEVEARRQVGVVYAPGSVGDRGAGPAGQGVDPISLVPKDQRTEAVKEFQGFHNKEKVLSSIGQAFQQWRDTSTLRPSQLDSTRSAISGTIMANVPGVRSDVDFKEIVEPNLPSRFDTEDTLRLKENTIRRFVESKTTTPILDAHAPGWRPKELTKKAIK